MRIWLLGTEGRLASMARHLKRHGHEVFFSGPGCPGTERHATRIGYDLKQLDFERMRHLRSEFEIELVVPGSEDLLEAGVVDELRPSCRVFGPTKAAAQIETDKLFSYQLMSECEIPQARTSWFVPSAYESAREAIRVHFDSKKGSPIVLKPRGRTGGKGVAVAWDLATAEEALSQLQLNKKYGEAGATVGLAEYLSGAECSVFIHCNGHEDQNLFLAVARDCKPLYPAKDGKPAGPNTGGMWSVSSIPDWTQQLKRTSMTYAWKVVSAMREKNTPFTGLLYISLKLTSEGPKVVEFNARFGDPEAQAVFQRLDSDLAPLLMASAGRGKLRDVPLDMSKRVGGCLVIAAPGYPDAPRKGGWISGIDQAEELGVEVEHCGTKLNERREVIVDGGRVLNLNASADNLSELREKLNLAASRIVINGGCQYRMDLGDPATAS